MIAKKEIERWLATLPDNAMVYVDDGGLTLVATALGWDERPYLEVGGDPDEE
jgi:hypothetical protein